VAEEHIGFHHVMKALQKYPLFEGSSLSPLCAYLADHYTSRERSLLHESLALLPNDLTRMAGLVSSVEWLETALFRNGSTSAGLEEARIMLRFFRDQRDRVALKDLEDYFPKMDREDLCAGIRAGLQRAVFFLSLRRSDLEPLIGVWPPAAQRLRRMAVVLAPTPVKAVRTFRHPYLVEDMTTLLLAARVEPIPLRRGDEKPFMRFVEEVSPALLSVPEWVESFLGLHQDGRIALALQAMRAAGLMIPDGSPAGSVRRHSRRGRRDRSSSSRSRHSRTPGIAAWKEPALVPAPWSAAWLSCDVAERRKKMTEMLSIGAGGPSGLFDLLEEERTSSERGREEVVPWLIQAFSSVPTASFIRFADFAEYQAAMGSPLSVVQTGGTAPDSAGSGSTATEEALEELWKSFLRLFMGRCLLSLDGVEVGVTEDGAACFRVTQVGRRILGLPGKGQQERETSQQEAAAIIVQPNFEIVFLGPSPAVEAALGRFCERVGREVGVLFRITKQSVLRGARSGLSHEEIMSPLVRNSRSGLPDNVRQEIQGWLAATDLDSTLPAT